MSLCQNWLSSLSSRKKGYRFWGNPIAIHGFVKGGKEKEKEKERKWIGKGKKRKRTGSICGLGLLFAQMGIAKVSLGVSLIFCLLHARKFVQNNFRCGHYSQLWLSFLEALSLHSVWSTSKHKRTALYIRSNNYARVLTVAHMNGMPGMPIPKFAQFFSGSRHGFRNMAIFNLKISCICKSDGLATSSCSSTCHWVTARIKSWIPVKHIKS